MGKVTRTFNQVHGPSRDKRAFKNTMVIKSLEKEAEMMMKM